MGHGWNPTRNIGIRLRGRQRSRHLSWRGRGRIYGMVLNSTACCLLGITKSGVLLAILLRLGMLRPSMLRKIVLGLLIQSWSMIRLLRDLHLGVLRVLKVRALLLGMLLGMLLRVLL
jgi:hypothetical protein